jgi:hypothetical protein
MHLPQPKSSLLVFEGALKVRDLEIQMNANESATYFVDFGRRALDAGDQRFAKILQFKAVAALAAICEVLRKFAVHQLEYRLFLHGWRAVCG